MLTGAREKITLRNWNLPQPLSTFFRDMRYNKDMKKVMVFGVFDGVHEGHRAMLKEARTYGDYLIAVVAQDHIVEHLKGHLPGINFAERFEHLEKEDSVDRVAIGDAELAVWNVVNKYEPDVIALGYDQSEIKEDLENNQSNFKKKPEIVVLKSFEPNKYHNRILNT